jgi:hypothetical protein
MAGMPWNSIEVGQCWSDDGGTVITIVGPDLLTNRWIVRDGASEPHQMSATEIRTRFHAPALDGGTVHDGPNESR